MVKSNYDKLKLEIDSIDESSKKQIEKLKDYINRMDKGISNLIETHGKLADKKAEVDANHTQLDSTLKNLISEDENLTSKLKSLKEVYEANESKLSDLNHKLRTLDTEIGKEELRDKNLLQEISSLEMKIEEIKKELVNAEGLYEEKVKTIENEIKEIQMEKESKILQFKILKKLLEDGYIKSPYYETCKVLNQPGLTSVDQLIRASAVEPAKVRQTLEELANLGIVEQDGTTYSIKKQIPF